MTRAAELPPPIFHDPAKKPGKFRAFTFNRDNRYIGQTASSKVIRSKWLFEAVVGSSP